MPVERYHAMIEAGLLTSDDRVELVEGVLVFRMSIKEIHNAVCRVMHKLIQPLLDPIELVYRNQESITLRDGEPQPDGAIVRGPDHYFAKQDRKPYEHEILWIGEAANTTLRTDRGVKLRSYARAAIPTYWIINLDSDMIEVYTDPDSIAVEPTYRAVLTFGRGQRVPVVVNGTTVGDVAVDDIFG